MRDNAERFLALWRTRDPRLVYGGGDMARVHARAAQACSIGYVRSDGTKVSLSYEEARRRLFSLSFDPYQCVERRWGPSDAELASCRDGTLKRRWYDAHQRLRNQIDRTYEARIDFTLEELVAGRGGVATAPDTDTSAFLAAQQQRN